MKSPITGKEMALKVEPRKMPFRKEEFTIPFQYYVCEDSGEQFTSTELDELNIQLLHNAYRSKYHIPSAEEIKAIRDKYKLPAKRMGEILGFGPNTYGNYEKGEVPGVPNAKLIRQAENPRSFRQMVADWQAEKPRQKEELLQRIDQMVSGYQDKLVDINAFLVGEPEVNEYTGYRKPSLEKTAQMVIFFIQQELCYKTKMNKLLFYADFLCFKSKAKSISGNQYRAISYGPVPSRYGALYDYMAQSDIIDIEIEEIEGGEKQLLIARDDQPFKAELFTEDELKILQKVLDAFKNDSPTTIVDKSHIEPAWISNKDTKELISYHYAFELKVL